MRKALTALFIVGGFLLMVVGYASSASWGNSTVADSDPAFPGAPTVFILGIVMVLAAALVYELLPEEDDDGMG